jgi:hypothetical protein
MSGLLSRLFGGGGGIPSEYYEGGEQMQPFDVGPPLPPRETQAGLGGLSPEQRTLLGFAALSDAFASLGGRQGGALQGAMPVANLLQEQQNTQRYREAVQRYARRPAEGGQPEQAPQPQAQPSSRTAAAEDETGGPFSRAAISRALDTLGQAEARGPGVINRLGYAGQYQIGAPLAVDAGVYRPAPGEISQRGEWSGQWGGQFNIPGFENVRTIQDFLQNPDAQRRAAELAMQVQAGRLNSMGLTGLVGQNVRNLQVTPESLLQGAWLGGPGGVQRFLERGEDAQDAFGTPVSRWMSLTPAQRAIATQQGAAPQAAAAPAPAAPRAGTPGMRTPSQEEIDVLLSLPPQIGYRILAERAAPTRVGLQPVMVEETDANGQRVVVPYFPTQTGELRRGQLPPGARVAEGIRTIDTGTGTQIVGGRTGAQVGVVPRQTVEREREEQVGRAAGIAQAAAPGVVDVTGRTIAQINEVIGHPSFSTATGVLSPLQQVPGTSAYDLGQRIEQIKGQAFLEAYNSLRGAGAITEQEGRTAQAAIARINSGLAPADLRKALDELRAIAERGRERALQAAQGVPVQPAQAPSQPPQRLRYNPQTGRIE